MSYDATDAEYLVYEVSTLESWSSSGWWMAGFSP